MARAVRIAGKILDAVFPRHCITCGAPNPPGKFRYLCGECASGPFAHQAARCRRCAEIVGGSVDVSGCAKCDGADFFFSAAKVACEYASSGRDLVLELKYRGGLHVARDMATICSASAGFAEYFRGAVLVPVPLHRSRLRSRGYNQSEVLCREIARANPGLGIEVSRILERRKATGTQTALTRDERAANVRGAFSLSARCSASRDAHLIVVDDVMTSGATLNECAKVLRRAGFSSVRVFAFARRS